MSSPDFSYKPSFLKCCVDSPVSSFDCGGGIACGWMNDGVIATVFVSAVVAPEIFVAVSVGSMLANMSAVVIVEWVNSIAEVMMMVIAVERIKVVISGATFFFCLVSGESTF